MISDLVVRVDTWDRPLGTCTKLEAHLGGGTLHRAVSVLVLDEAGRLLVQRRAAEKHHFRLRWSNTCCTHPRPGEDVVAAGRRRTVEEMGLWVDPVPRGRFRYRATDRATGLVEHEVDHVLVATSAGGDPVPDPREVDDWAWVTPRDLHRWMRAEPSSFTPWLPLALRLAAPRWWDAPDFRTGADG